jgi:hypothetical protein
MAPAEDVPGDTPVAAAGDEVREPAFDFKELGRRDPFCFARAPKPDDGDMPRRVVTVDPQDLTRLAGSYLKAEQEFLDGDYTAASRDCGAALAAIGTLSPKAALVLEHLNQELTRLDRACTRQIERIRAERDFETMAIKVSGVVARDRHSVAVVNAQVMQQGDCVSSGAEIVSLEEVRPECVVFRFRGFLMEAPIEK